jgi:hypothetical protein
LGKTGPPTAAELQIRKKRKKRPKNIEFYQ